MTQQPAITYQELTPQHRAQAIAVLAEALMIEPGFVHILPDDAERRLALRATMTALISTATRRGTVWIALENERVLGVAVWAAPGRYPAGWLETVRTMHHTLGLIRLGRHKTKMLQEFDHNCLPYYPDSPCWYLQAFGIDPAAQGKGLGSGMMRHMLAEIGTVDCYLETATPANVGFYERFGFGVRNPAAQLTPTGGPTHWTMLRPGQ